MAKRPAAPASAAPAKADFENVRVRKIANGHVTTHLGVKDGKFFKTERYSRSRPKVTPPVAPKPATRRPTAPNEVGYLNRSR